MHTLSLKPLWLGVGSSAVQERTQHHPLLSRAHSPSTPEAMEGTWAERCDGESHGELNRTSIIY